MKLRLKSRISENIWCLLQKFVNVENLKSFLFGTLGRFQARLVNK